MTKHNFLKGASRTTNTPPAETVVHSSSMRFPRKPIESPINSGCILKSGDNKGRRAANFCRSSIEALSRSEEGLGALILDAYRGDVRLSCGPILIQFFSKSSADIVSVKFV